MGLIDVVVYGIIFLYHILLWSIAVCKYFDLEIEKIWNLIIEKAYKIEDL